MAGARIDASGVATTSLRAATISSIGVGKRPQASASSRSFFTKESMSRLLERVICSRRTPVPRSVPKEGEEFKQRPPLILS
jgi:hypothetical protein